MKQLRTNLNQRANTVGKVALTVAVAMSLGMAVIPARADAYLFSASSPDGKLSASVDFSLSASGTDLIVTLINTSMADVLKPSGVLTGVFFDIAGVSSLSRSSAVLAPSSSVIDGTTDPGGVVGGEWGYRAGLSGAPLGATQGISAAGFGLFGPGDRFPGTNLAPPPSGSLAGVEYGITSAGDVEATGNVDGTPLIKNSVVFTLGGLPSGFTESAISNVSFQYGSNLDGNIPAVPEPGTLLLLGSGVVGMGMFGRYISRRS